jgi:Ca-activated chloride channel family protein
VEKVKSITAGGSTNLSDGLAAGYRILENRQSEDASSRKIFLFSDGCANSGVTSKEGIKSIVEKYYENGVGTRFEQLWLF